MYLPLCAESRKPNRTRHRHEASLSPKRTRQDHRDSGVSTAVWRGAGSAIIPDPPPRHGASLDSKRPKQDQRDSGVSAAIWGGVENRNVHGTPTGRPYPTNRPRRTGETGVHPRLCGQDLKDQSYLTP